VTIALSIVESILTQYLLSGVENLPDAEFASNDHGFAVIETARLASLPDHTIHSDVGISVRDRGVVTLQAAVRLDELQQPLVWVRTSGPTAELLARATVGQFFGFRPRGWVDDANANAEAVVCDESAALAPLEAGFREDLTRAWFVLTGFRFVSHVLAVPRSATSAEVAAVAAWMESGGGLTKERRRAIWEKVAEETGAPLEEVTTLLSGVKWTLDSDDRRSIAEFFARAGVANQVGAIPWRRDNNEPGE
jgi:hypothetical protein